MHSLLTLFLRLVAVTALVIASLGGADVRLLQTVAASTAAEPQTPAGVAATSTVLSGAVTVDAVSTGQVSGATSLTVAHSTGSSANRLMLVGVSINRETSATGDKVTGITYSGQALTLVGAKTDGGSGEARVEMWALKNPPTGAANVVVTFNRANADGAVVGVATFAGVDQTTPYGAFYSNSGNGTTATLSVTSAAGELVFDTVSLRSVGFGASGSPGAGQTARWKTYFNSRVGAGGSTESGAATVTMSWTAASAADWAIGALAIKPAQTPQIAITKALTTPAPIYAGQELSFTIRITNTGPSTVAVLPLIDWYDSTTLSFVSAVPPPNTTATGTLTWNDLTTTLGDLAPGQTVAVVTRFQALKATTAVSLAAAGAGLASEAGGGAAATGAPDLVSPNWNIEVWPTATCSGWQILFQRAYGTAAENWRAKVDGTIIASGTTYGNNETVTGAWPTSLDLTTSHTFLAEIYEGSSWLGRSATFGNCPAPATGSIGDRVWYDANGDKAQQAGELGLNGVTVNLYGGACPATGRPTGTPQKTMLTAGDGAYDFTGLTAGAYCVAVDTGTLPAAFALTTANEPLTVNLASAQDFNTADFGYQAQCAQGALNLAMVREATDQANAVISDRGDFTCVEIKPGAKLALSKALTSGQPAYLGQELSFTIRITNTGSTTLAILPLQDWFDPTTLEFLGATPAASATGSGTLAWADLTTSLGDVAPGQEVAVVTRFRALKATTAVSLAAAGAGLASEAGGGAAATGAPDLVSPNWNIEVWPTATCSGWQILFQRAYGTASENWRAKVDGTIIASGTTTGNNQTVTGTWPSSLNLTTAHTFLAEIYEGSSWLGRSATFGNCPAPATASIGDRVFYDLNGSGLPDDGAEPGSAGVSVRLFSNTCTGTPLKTAATAGNGGYSFTSLAAGTYCVNVDPSTVPAGYQLTTGNMPLTVNLATGQSYTTADFGYQAQCVNGTVNLALVKGAVDATGTALKEYQSYACAVIEPARATIGDYVWNDTNGDGIQNDGANAGLGGVILALYRDDGDNVFEPGAGDTLVMTRTTAAGGGYQFTSVVPGTYWVDVPAENPFLTGYTFMPGVESGPEPKLVTVAANDAYTTADFGYAGKGLISGNVFYDWNRSGVQDLNEGPIPSVEVCLYKDNNRDGLLDGGDTKLTCMLTDNGGAYAFAGQVAGAYLVVQTQPASLQTTTPNLLPVNLVVVGTGGSAPDNNFGEIVYVRLGDMVYIDINGNGSQDAGETFGVSNVPLVLTGTNIRGDSVNWTGVTGIDGRYLVDNLLPGTYTVKAPTQFNGYQLISQASRTTALTTVITEDLTLDFGYILPTGVGVYEFKAAVGRGQVTLNWLATGPQAPSFHVRRADNSKGAGTVQVTAQPVTSGTGEYQFVDRGVVVGQTYWYMLEDADAGQAFGPLAVTVAPMSIRAFLPAVRR